MSRYVPPQKLVKRHATAGTSGTFTTDLASLGRFAAKGEGNYSHKTEQRKYKWAGQAGHSGTFAKCPALQKRE
jgi:hypothetical protein